MSHQYKNSKTLADLVNILINLVIPENPFGTTSGQIVTSESESYLQRLMREGKPYGKSYIEEITAATGTALVPVVNPAAGYDLYIDQIILSFANQAADTGQISYTLTIDNNISGVDNMDIAVIVGTGKSLTIDLKGLKVPGNGSFKLDGTSTVDGVAHMCVIGTEVAA